MRVDPEEQIKRESIVEKAKKLIQLQERAGTPGEALAAAKALAGLLDKHRIALAELESAGAADPEAFVLHRDEPLYAFQRVQVWRRDLCYVLGEHYGVATWQRTRKFRDGRPSDHFICACGRRTDIELLRSMYVWLGAEIERLSASECQGLGGRYANSWRLGFVAGVQQQLRGLREQNCEASTTAMVVYGRSEQALDYLRSQLEKLGTVKYRHRGGHDRWAFQSGFVRGWQQHLGPHLPESGGEPQPD